MSANADRTGSRELPVGAAGCCGLGRHVAKLCDTSSRGLAPFLEPANGTLSVTGKPKLSPNGLVVDDSPAQPLDRTGRGIVVSPSRLLAAVPRFLMVANQNRQCAASDSGRASHQTGAEGYTTMFEWRLRERNRQHVVSREGSVSC